MSASIQDLRERLLHKLRGGDKRYAHLNATTNNSRQKMDLSNLDLIEDGLFDKFIDELLSNEKFSFKIPLKQVNSQLLEYTNRKDEVLKEDKTELLEKLKKLADFKKGLQFLEAHQKEEFSEYGTKSVAFGYPLLVKQIKAEKEDLICAPLFLWYLEVERDYLTDSIVLSRTEDSPILFNEMLDYYLESELRLDFSDAVQKINERIFDDGLLDKQELEDSLIHICDKLDSSYSRELFAEITAVPTNKTAAAKLLKEKNTSESIINAGLISVFRSGKQSIINDLKLLLIKDDADSVENNELPSLTEYPFSSIETDPSQEKLIEALSESRNLIIQGPPGTGKSQTLTAIITNALANNQRVLVVCEKRTAMEIIKSNLQNVGLSDYVALIENVNRDRSNIVDHARDIYDTRSRPHYMVRSKFETVRSSAESAALKIARHHDAIHKSMSNFSEVIVPNKYDNKYFLGKYLEQDKKVNSELLNLIENKIGELTFELNEIELEKILADLRLAAHSGQIIDSPIKLIPKLNLIKQDYKSDNKELTSYFMSKVQDTENLKQKIDDYVLRAANELDIRTQNEVKALKLMSAEALKLFIPFDNKFSKQTFLDHLEKSEIKNSASYERNAKKYVEQFTEINNNLESFIQARNVFIDTKVSTLNSYFSTIKEIKELIIKINSSGTKSLEITKADKILSPFAHKRKDLKLLKIKLFQAEKTANHAVNDLSAFIQLNSINLKNTSISKANLSPSKNQLENDLSKAIHGSNIDVLQLRIKLSEGQKEETVDHYEKSLLLSQKNTFLKIQESFADIYASLIASKYSEYVRDITGFTSLDVKNSITIRNYFERVKDTTLNDKKIHEDNELHVSNLSAYDVDAVRNCKEKALNIVSSDQKFSFALVSAFEALKSTNNIKEIRNGLEQLNQLITRITQDINDKFYGYYNWCKTYSELSVLSRELIDCFETQDIPSNKWQDLFLTVYYKRVLTNADLPDLLTDNNYIDRLSGDRNEIKSLLIDTIKAGWASERLTNIGSFEKGLLRFTSLYNKRGSKGQRRNSLRKIIERDFELFTSLFPVVICNPGSSSSLFELKKDLFDLVLFDEASQLRLEDTYTSLYRGRTKIVSGDKHQMPPSNYFQAVIEGDQEDYDDDADMQIDESARSESLLDYADTNGYRSEMLKIHYRSEHENLIEFSNHAFYGGRLAPIPSLSDYNPIEFNHIMGTYLPSRTNKAEAEFVSKWIQDYISNNNNLRSIGVVTLNLQQADLIKEMLAEERTRNADFNRSMVRLDELGFFVKNLENVQGDERDIMILSTTFGNNEEGKFKQLFGPLSRSNSYRLLNVLVTRAKHKFIIATSVPLENISQYEAEITVMGKDKRAIFYAYLAYARAVSEGSDKEIKYILSVLSEELSTPLAIDSGTTESPFEEEVLEAIESEIDPRRIVLQYKVGGENFRIDMVLMSKDLKRPLLAIECDGYTYHSSPDAYLYDLYRQKILEKKGFKFYRIWSTNWFHDFENEKMKLISRIRSADNQA